jgi:hypothetical protein
VLPYSCRVLRDPKNRWTNTGARTDSRLEALSFDVLHRNEGQVLILVDFGDRADIRVVQRCSSLGLVDKTAYVLLRADRPRREELERNRTPELVSSAL